MKNACSWMVPATGIEKTARAAPGAHEVELMRIRRFLLFVSVCLPLALSGFAQDNVRLTVTVTGSDGAPVRVLKKADFSLQDSGKPRTIDTFVSPLAPLVAPQLEANEYSNAPIAGEAGTIFVVLDTIHTRYIDERDMRELILKFLGNAAQAKRAVALAILSAKGLRVYHDYQTSSNVLLAGLIKAGLGGMKGGTPPAGVNDAEVTAEAARLTAFSKGDLANPTPPEQLVRSSVDMPMIMFQDVGHAAYGLPGYKALVWVTNITPFDIDPKTFQFMSNKEVNQGVAVAGAQTGGTKDALSNDEIKRILPIWRRSMRSLSEGGVAVYPVEARGSSSAGANTYTNNTMKLLGQLTGGKGFYGSNDPFPEILQISNGNLAGYALGFAGDANPSSGFHRVQVTANKPGSVLNAPLGYFPLEGTLKSRAQDDVSLGLQSPLAFTGLPFSVQFTGNEDNAGKKKVNMAISLRGDSGVLNEATRTVDLAVIAVAKDAKDATVGKLNENSGGQFPPEAVAQIKELGFQLSRSIEVPTGDFTLHFVIRDNQTGRMGSLIVPLKVP